MSFPLDVAAVPDPAGVVALVQGLVRDPWPVTESGREGLFGRLGLQTAGPRSGQFGYIHGTEKHFALELPLTGAAVGTWVLADNVFRNIYVQLLPGAEPLNPQATACFEAIIRSFTELYGEATIPGTAKRAAGACGTPTAWNWKSTTATITAAR